MKVAVNRIISRGQGMAQVTVLLGEGSKRRSATRHIGRQGDTWFGNNPDPTAVDRNKTAERVLEQARTAVEALEERIRDGEAAMADTLTPEELTGLGVSTQNEGKVAIAKIVSGLRVRLAEANSALATAKQHKAEVERNFPLVVEFTGGGL